MPGGGRAAQPLCYRLAVKLYQGWQSSASWRVRWALALKRVEVEPVYVDVASGDHLTALAPVNPMRQVPALELDDGQVLTESSAIIEWLDETIADPPLLPADPLGRARARQLAQIVNAGIQPLQNTQVRVAISSDDEAQRAWCRRWIERGLRAYDEHVRREPGPFSLGERITLPDLFLVPQVLNAERFDADVTDCVRVLEIYRTCMATDEARRTRPRKPEAPQPKQ